MNQNVIAEWIVSWLAEHASVSKDDVKKHLSENYFDLGYIDSFGFIELLDSIESEYGVQCDNEQFEDRKFATISGLAEIIETALG